MNYYTKCPHCKKEVYIYIEMPHGQPIDMEIPDECPECGFTFNIEKIEKDIYDVIKNK